MRGEIPGSALKRRVLLAVVIVLAGCGSMKPLPSDTFYRLNAAETAPAAAAWTADPVRVAKFSASGVHRERPVAFSEADELVVKQHRYHLWIDTPERMLRDELVSYLRRARVAPIVTGSKIAGDNIEIRGRIERMDKVAGPDLSGVSVELHFELVVRGKTEKLVLSREYRETRSVTGENMGAVAGAMSDAVGAIFAQFTADAGSTLGGDTNVSDRLED